MNLPRGCDFGGLRVSSYLASRRRNLCQCIFSPFIRYAPNNNSFSYVSHWTSQPTAPFPWQPARHASNMPWPPLGLRLSVNFTAPPTALPQHREVVVTVHYEMYVIVFSLKIRECVCSIGLATSVAPVKLLRSSNFVVVMFISVQS